MEPFLIVHYTKTSPLFTYAGTLEMATNQVESWLVTNKDESARTIVIIHTPDERVVYHKRLNQPDSFAALLNIVQLIRQWVKRSLALTAISLQLN